MRVRSQTAVTAIESNLEGGGFRWLGRYLSLTCILKQVLGTFMLVTSFEAAAAKCDIVTS